MSGEFRVEGLIRGKWVTQADWKGDTEFATEKSAASFADNLAEESSLEKVRVVRLVVLYTVGRPLRRAGLRRE